MKGIALTTQPTVAALVHWATGLSAVYLEGALDRALTLTAEASVVLKLTRAEYERLADAEQLETAAEKERTAAGIDRARADIAREDADRLGRERLVTEAATAAQEEAEATLEAHLHDDAAQAARSKAAAAGRRAKNAQPLRGADRHDRAARRRNRQ